MQGKWSELFSDKIRSYLANSGLYEPTEIQKAASPLILEGKNVLLIAPTGSGKTEAAIIPLLERLLSKGKSQGISLLYITPLRALNRDMLKRLNSICSTLGLRVQIRHGDTPQRERSKQSQSPPDLLITTPETLQSILPSRKMRSNLSALKAVVIDEVHSIVESKRGTQLSVALERLKEVVRDFQIVALSATIGSPEVLSSFIFGNKEYEIVVSQERKSYSFSIHYPIPSDERSERYNALSAPELSARLYVISELIDKHDSTLIFVNSRTIAEMLCEKLSRIRKDVGVHHGSLPREERERVEMLFRNRELKALVCTSTLELGIDIGSVDLVIHYMSPRQVVSLLQRTGRSGHSLKRVSDGNIIAVSFDDIIESAAAIKLSMQKKIEPVRIYENSLDVLAHQIAGYVLDFESIEKDDLFKKITNAFPYRELKREEFDYVINYLSEIGKIRLEDNKVKRSYKTREYYYQNLSMIPDETRYIVVDATNNQSVGILGEEFVLLRVRKGIHFILKGRVWQVEKVTDDRKVYVTPVDDPLAALPGWEGEMAPVHYLLASEAGKLRRELSSLISNNNLEEADKLLLSLCCNRDARSTVIQEISEHLMRKAPVPSDRIIVLEGFGKYLIIHSCFGEAVNRAFGFSFEEILSRMGLVRLWWMDGYRILFELTEDTRDIDLEDLASTLFKIKPWELEEYYRVAAQRNFPFPERVKNVAMRFGALKRGMYISHPNLCSLPTRFEKTPIYKEAYKETMQDLIDMETAKKIIEMVRKGGIEVKTYKSETKPTPIAYHILYKYIEVPEAIAPDSLGKSIETRMKIAIESTYVTLVCMKCSNATETKEVGKLDEHPKCTSCNSSLLVPCFYDHSRISEIIRKKISSEELSEDEKRELSRARRAADLVLSYGKKAVYALSVYGIGPQTAARILSEMHERDEEFYSSLLNAKLRFISTRVYWKE